MSDGLRPCLNLYEEDILSAVDGEVTSWNDWIESVEGLEQALPRDDEYPVINSLVSQFVTYAAWYTEPDREPEYTGVEFDSIDDLFSETVQRLYDAIQARSSGDDWGTERILVEAAFEMLWEDVDWKFFYEADRHPNRNDWTDSVSEFLSSFSRI